jgi:hypothetical protein
MIGWRKRGPQMHGPRLSGKRPGYTKNILKEL